MQEKYKSLLFQVEEKLILFYGIKFVLFFQFTKENHQGKKKK